MGNTIFMGFAGAPVVLPIPPTISHIRIHGWVVPDASRAVWGHRRISPWACCRTGWRWPWNHPRGWSPTCFAPTFPSRTQTVADMVEVMRKVQRCAKHGGNGMEKRWWPWKHRFYFECFLTFLDVSCYRLMLDLLRVHLWRSPCPISSGRMVRLSRQQWCISQSLPQDALWPVLLPRTDPGWDGSARVGFQTWPMILVSGALQLRTTGLEHPLSAPRPTFVSIPQYIIYYE